MSDRPARDITGTGQLMPAVSGDARNDTLIVFSRNGWSNPAGIQRPAEQRVRYRYVDGSLVREHWLSVDPALNAEPRARVLLTRVKALEIRFLDPLSRQWSNEWPVAGPTGPVTPANVHLLMTRPLAIEFTVVFEDWGPFSACSRFPHEARESARHRAAGGDRDVCDRDHGRGRHHLQQGDVGQAAIAQDIDNFKSALAGVNVADAFMPVAAPMSARGLWLNAYYKNDEEIVVALADALREEYKAIVDAGFILQLDDAFLAHEYDRLRGEMGEREVHKYAERCVDLTNYALTGIPEEKVRYHVCWGSWTRPTPRTCR